MNALCRNLQPKMTAIDLLFEDLFVMTCSIMDDIKEDPNDFYVFHLSSLWEEIAGELRLYPKAPGNEHAIDNAISTMLYMLCLFLAQWSHPDKGKYQTVIFEHLGEHRAISDEVRMDIDTQLNKLRARGKTASLPNYLESEEYVSMDVDEQLITVEDKTGNEYNNPVEKNDGLTNSQLVLLFVELLHLDLRYCNINGLAKLLSAVSGRSQGSLYNKINEYRKKWDEKADEMPFRQDAISISQYLSNISDENKNLFDFYIEK